MKWGDWWGCCVAWAYRQDAVADHALAIKHTAEELAGLEKQRSDKIGARFEARTARPSPRPPVATVLASARPRRPRYSWSSGVQRDRAVCLGAVALPLVALAVAAAPSSPRSGAARTSKSPRASTVRRARR